MYLCVAQAWAAAALPAAAACGAVQCSVWRCGAGGAGPEPLPDLLPVHTIRRELLPWLLPWPLWP